MKSLSREESRGSVAPLSIADPFDAGPYARVQAALNRRRLWSLRAPYRAAALAAVAWVPLLVLAVVQGLAWNDRLQDSLLLDPSVYTRYLVTLPVLVLAQPVSLLPLAMIARYFPEAGLISGADRPRYESLLLSARSLLDHRGAEVVLVLLAYFATLASAGTQYPAAESSWVAPIIGGERHLSLAGWWRLLVKSAATPHSVGCVALADRGLGSLSLARRPARPAPGAGASRPRGRPRVRGDLDAGVLAHRIRPWCLGRRRDRRRRPPGGAGAGRVPLGAGVLLVLVLGLFVAPMLVFSAPLIRARVRGAFAYGELAEALGRQFEQRWLGQGPELDEDALAAPDFSATTDLYSIAANVRNMRMVPFDLRELIPLLVAALIPFVPLVFAITPLKEVLQFAKKLLL